jgi:leader peptidase (prepilin peptidase)/N-methyltransferase
MLNVLGQLPVIVWTLWAFVLGASVGSLLNVVVARLPVEKSILWPGSRCGNCLQAIRMRDNIPLLSYWLLGGRCRKCGERFSIQYFLVELFTGAAFAAVFWLEVIANVRQSPFIQLNTFNIRGGMLPWQVWLLMLQRWTLLAFLIAIAVCDLRSREIPLSVTLCGTGIGLLFALLLPWPWPDDAATAPVGPQPWAFLLPPARLPSGAQLWPAWGPLPDWLAPGTAPAGLATGIVGALVGTFLVRGVRFLATRGLGREALGLGDADLMMMVGSFLGWQAVVVSFFVGALAALGIAVIQVVVFRDDSLPFGPGLAVGAVATWLGWAHLGPAIQPLAFDATLLGFVVGAGGGLLFVLCWLMGRLRPPPA